MEEDMLLSLCVCDAILLFMLFTEQLGCIGHKSTTRDYNAKACAFFGLRQDNVIVCWRRAANLAT